MSSINPYESGKQKIIPAVLLYAFYENQVLMIHRNTKPYDFHEGKWNGLGGKLELGETFVQAATREFYEEASAQIPQEQWKWVGQLYFPNFKPHKKEDWLVNIFVTTLSREQAAAIRINALTTPEGSLHFVMREHVLTLNLWDGDQYFLPHVFTETPFMGTFFYQDGRCSKFELMKI